VSSAVERSPHFAVAVAVAVAVALLLLYRCFYRPNPCRRGITPKYLNKESNKNKPTPSIAFPIGDKSSTHSPTRNILKQNAS
jgi:hypothetical protein